MRSELQQRDEVEEQVARRMAQLEVLHRGQREARAAADQLHQQQLVRAREEASNLQAALLRSERDVAAVTGRSSELQDEIRSAHP